MKRAKHLSLLACSILTVPALAIAEPAQSVAPPAADATAPDGLQWLGKYKWPYGNLFTGNPAGVFRTEMRLAPPSTTCYFIQTLRPVPGDSDAKRSGFIPLQTHTTGTERGPVCTNPGMFQPLVPVAHKAAAASDNTAGSRSSR